MRTNCGWLLDAAVGNEQVFSQPLAVGGCSGSGWCRGLGWVGVRRSLCSSPGQEMLRCPPPLESSKGWLSWGAGARLGSRHEEGELEPGSPAVIYGGAGNEAGWQ